MGSSSSDSSSSIASQHFTEGQEIEVYSRASDQESCGWWRAVIKMIKGDFHVVEYLGWETTYTEVCFYKLWCFTFNLLPYFTQDMALAITVYFNLLHFTLDCTDRAFTEQVAGATFEQNHLQ